MRKMAWIMFVLLFLIGCTEKVSVGNEENTDQLEQNKEENNVTVMDEIVTIDASVQINQSEEAIVVEGKTNLLAGTLLTVDVFEEAYGEKQLISHDYKVEVNSDQTFKHEIKLGNDFFKKYNNRPIEVSISLDMFGYPDETMKQVYGEKGEHFKGPLVYVSDEVMERNYIYTSVFIMIGKNEETYEIKAPERLALPNDYGDKNVWIEAQVIGKDEQFFYVEGTTNLIQGFQLQGRYYSDKDNTVSQKVNSNIAEVQPDGRFWLPVEYDTISKNGMIEIIGYNSERTKEMVNETYGRNLERMQGDIVEDRGKHQRIRLGLTNEGKRIELAKQSLVVEEKGQFKIEMSDEILFDVNESSLKSISKMALDEIIYLLEGLEAGIEVHINGHTDSVGNPEENMQLSEERAISVEEYIKQFGEVDHLTFIIKGYGHTKPVASNDDEKGRQKNRRVEIVFKE